MKKKISYLLQLWDGLWSVPLCFCLFWLVGFVLNGVMGMAAGTYDPGFIQPLLLSGCVVIGATNMALLGLYFTFRGFFRFLYGQKKADGGFVNSAKEEWLKLTALQKFLLAIGVQFYFITATILVYLKFV